MPTRDGSVVINLDEAKWTRNSTATPQFSLNETATSMIGLFQYSMLIGYIIVLYQTFCIPDNRTMAADCSVESILSEKGLIFIRVI